MSYIDQNLISGETVSYRTRLHWIVMFWPTLVAVFFGLIALSMIVGAIATRNDTSTSGMGTLGLVFLVIAVTSFGLGIIYRSSTEMAVTNKRVLAKVGLIGRRTTEMMLSKVESISVDQSIFGRMFNYGTITVRGTGGTPEPFSKISHPLEFRRQVQQELDKSQLGMAATSAQ